MALIDAAAVTQGLPYTRCIPAMREAMIALSDGSAPKTLRSAMGVGPGLFGVMFGSLDNGRAVFGAKLLGIFPDPVDAGHSRHQGVVILFDGASGAPLCSVDAEAITTIRTASASAAATTALARPDAVRLAILGCGTQAFSHIAAHTAVRRYESITVWGRRQDRAEQFSARVRDELGLEVVVAPNVRAAVAECDVVCTVTGATEPILKGAWLRPGTHVNLVGSSLAGPAEADDDLVASARFIVDSTPSALVEAAEYLNARAAGRIGDDHIAGEIGEVYGLRREGRRNRDEITVYKSLGHIVQDLAAARLLAVDAGLFQDSL